MVRTPSVDDLYSLALPEDPAISPDGARVVYVVRSVDRVSDRDIRSLWCVDTAGGTPRPWSQGPSDRAPRWSPDGGWLCFLRGSDDGPAQLWRVSADGGDETPITALPMGAGAGVWSPDSRTIAIVVPAGEGEPDSATPIVVDRLDYQSDGSGFAMALRRLLIVDAFSGEVRALAVVAPYVGEPAWAPDGTRIAFAAGLAADSDLTGESRPYIVDLADPAPAPRPIGPAHGGVGPVLWTADGRALLAVGRVDTAAGHLGLLRIPVDGADGAAGGIVDLAAPLDRNVMPGATAYPGGRPQLCDGGERVVFCARDAGCTHLFTVEVGGGTPRLLLGGAGRVVSGLSVSAGGTAAVVLATPTSFGEIVVTTLDGPEREGVVHTAHSVLPADVELVQAQSVCFTISDGARVHGWLLRSAGAVGPRPLLLDVHGGPHNAWSGAADVAHLYQQEMVALGWTILMLNPRGSDGYGADFFTGVHAAWGLADTQDFLEPIDELVAAGLADPDRLAVAGYSYGGFTACQLTSCDDRFAAAVAGGPVTDLISISGSADLGPEIARTELGSTWWSAQQRLRELSPLARIEFVRTPTLILQGMADLRCPVGQAQQWFAGLRERRVPAQLVLYPRAAHSFVIDGRPSHRADYQQRLIDWVRANASGHRPPFAGGGPAGTADYQRRLVELTRRYRVPGAVLGILRVRSSGADEITTAACGVLNTRTGAPVTAESLFQIGSITKVWTTTLAAQLSDEGLLDLDAPISSLLPELRLADPTAAEQVTMRHLLSHTSGLDGDVFLDTGRGEDCLERYVAALGDTPQLFAPGTSWSYCNAGFVIAGRVIERLTGLGWDEALRRRLIEPLSLGSTVTLAEDALLHSVAVGHLIDESGHLAPAPFWSFPRSIGPAGMITSSVGDLLRFAGLHLRRGVAPDGSRLLHADTVAALQARQITLPDLGSDRDSWGLGWGRFNWDGRRAFGHDGGTIGQAAFLRVLPEQGFAVALLTNADNGDSGRAGELAGSLLREVFADLVGIELPGPPGPPEPPVSVDVSQHVGVYERTGTRLEVLVGPDGALLRTVTTDPLVADLPGGVQEFAMMPVAADRYLIRRPGAAVYTPLTFYCLGSGLRFAHLGGRATPKVG